MKYKKTVWLFWVSLILCIAIRTFQQFFQIDRQTGFFLRQYTLSGLIGLGIAAVLIAAAVASAFSVRRHPTHMPRVNPLLCAISFAIAVTGLFEFTEIKIAANISFWKVIMLVASLGMYILFMAAYAFKGIKNYPLKRILYVIPVIYWVVRIIVVFSNISSVAVIGDNVISILSHCAIILFSLEFAKAANNFDLERDCKRLLASGYAAALLSLTSSLPRIWLMIADSTAVMHESVILTVMVLFEGLFALLFVSAYFSTGNLYRCLGNHGDKDDFGDKSQL